MQVPLLDLRPQLATLEDEIKAAVNDVIDSTQYIGGPRIAELEEAICKYTGSQHSIGVSSGTDALLVALMALDVGPGDIVVTTPFSFFASAGVVARLGATPAFVDIDADSYNMDPEALDSWFRSTSAPLDRVRAIMPIHLYGQCADLGPILETGAKYAIPVIEDAAQSLGSRYDLDGDYRHAGTMGTIGCFSFFPTKNLGCVGDGGMVITNDADLAEKIRRLKNHGASPKYYHAMIGGNFRLDPIQAAVLSVKLPHLENWHEGRRENARRYDRGLEDLKITTPAITWKREFHIYNQYVISVPERRDELRTFLAENGVASEIYYPVSFHEQQCFHYLGHTQGDFPRSEHASRHTLALPIYPELPTEAQNHVTETIRQFYA